MHYRSLGRTGHQVSAIGIGLENVDGKPYEDVKAVVDAALDAGVNIFDAFMPGQAVRENIARALGSRRGDVLIQGHIGSTDVGQKYDISRDMPTVRRYFEDLLRIFGGHIDLGMMFFIDSEKDFQGVFDTEFITYVQRLKQQGDIGHIGFSSHNPAMATRVIETGVPEVMMFSVNLAYDLNPADRYVLDDLDAGAFRGLDPTRAALYRLCEQRGIGITTMKTLGAGKLISAEHTPFARPLTVQQCVHYALSRPAVASTLLGCSTAAQVQDAMRYFTLEADALDYADVLGTMRNDFRGNCVYCSHCQPCPMDIDIAAVNKYLDIARLDVDNIPSSIQSHYRGLAHAGADCTACGSCEARCPFGVPIIDNMQAADTLLG